MAIDTNNINEIKVDSRDFASIYADLVDSVQNMSQNWNTSDESDVGVLLIKLISMYGDMLSYNHDKAVLEVYPATVSQRKNAVQVFGLVGYKLHWYQSAKCMASLTNIGTSDATLPKFTSFATQNGDTTYTYIGNQTNIPANGNTAIEVELVQGVPKTPSFVGADVVPADPNKTWHTVYNYNVSSEDIIAGNKIYLDDITVDETSIILIDDSGLGDGQEWKQVDNVDALTYTGRYFELKTDSDDRPYIELVSYWQNFGATKFKLFYLVSAGINGQVEQNSIVKATSRIIKTVNGNQVDVSSDINIVNDNSTYGFDAETPDEARDNVVNYINTYDTLITASDFEKATRRIEGVANCVVTDLTTDPNPSDFDGNGTPFANNDVKIYVTKTEAFEQSVTDAVFRTTILNELQKNKLMPLNLMVDFDDITYYNWTIKGTIYLKEKVDKTTANNIYNSVIDAIQQAYKREDIRYNSVIGYSGLINTIHSASPLIYNVDVDGIEYCLHTYDIDGNITSTTPVTDKTVITGKKNDKVDITAVTTYTATLDAPIKPSSLTISFDNGRSTIYDDKAGGLSCESALFLSGTVDYQTGDITVNFTTAMTTNLNITYQQNVINMVLPEINAGDLEIAEDSIKV